jgi:serine/threonine protein kinase
MLQSQAQMSQRLTNTAANENGSQLGSLRAIAKECFQQVGNGQGVDVGGLVQLRKVMSQMLGIPEDAFGSLQVQHLRFNLSGTGCLTEDELYKLMKMNLRKYHRKTGSQHGAKVPCKNLVMGGYQIVEKKGRGNQSTAYLGKNIMGHDLCIKTFRKPGMSASDLDNIRQEFELLNGIAAHPTIPKVLDLFQDNDHYFTVGAFHEGGDFSNLRQKVPSSLLTENWWRDVCRQCFEGLGHLHLNSILHCDLKESNLMLKSTNYNRPEVVIIDFGLMQTFTSDEKLVTGTPGYIPPEVWEYGKWFPAGDMFAMGVVVMQLLLDRVPPHHNPGMCEVLPGGIFTQGAKTYREAAVLAKTREPPFEAMPRELAAAAQLLRKVLDKDVKRRPMAQQVLCEEWFRNNQGPVMIERNINASRLGLFHNDEQPPLLPPFEHGVQQAPLARRGHSTVPVPPAPRPQAAPSTLLDYSVQKFPASQCAQFPKSEQPARSTVLDYAVQALTSTRHVGWV